MYSGRLACRSGADRLLIFEEEASILVSKCKGEIPLDSLDFSDPAGL